MNTISITEIVLSVLLAGALGPVLLRRKKGLLLLLLILVCTILLLHGVTTIYCIINQHLRLENLKVLSQGV